MTLYADVNGRQFPVTRGQDVGKYQVWDHMQPLLKELSLSVSYSVVLENRLVGAGSLKLMTLMATMPQ